MSSKKTWLFIVMGVALIVICAGIVLRPGSPRSTPVQVRLGDATLSATVVMNDEERTRGLSGSKPLADDQAMLFVFPMSSQWGIWMKEMNYPIDIVWLDENKVVRHIVEDAQPSSYPKIFKPSTDVRYVLEMKSGVTDHKRITIGSQAEFDTLQKET